MGFLLGVLPWILYWILASNVDFWDWRFVSRWLSLLAPELTKEGLAALGCTDVDPEVVQKLDSIDAIPALERVGKAAAQRQVDESHLNFEVFRP